MFPYNPLKQGSIKAAFPLFYEKLQAGADLYSAPEVYGENVDSAAHLFGKFVMPKVVWVRGCEWARLSLAQKCLECWNHPEKPPGARQAGSNESC